MDLTNVFRQVQKLWEDRHTHDDDTTADDIQYIRELIERDGDTVPTAGAYVHMTRGATQTIAVNGEAISWDSLHPFIVPLAFPVGESDLPVTEVEIPLDGYYGLLVEAEWSSHTAGGTVEYRRERNGNTVKVAPTDDDPDQWTSTDGQKGSWFAVFPCQFGDLISVFLDADDASSQDLAKATLTLYKIETGLERQLYKQLILSAGPLAYWRLDETSGTTLEDIAGHADGPFDMTTSGSPTLDQTGIMTDGSGNAAADFEAGSNQYALATEDDSLKFLGMQAFTVEAWVKPESYRESASDGLRTIISCLFSNSATDEDGWRLAWTATDDAGPLAFQFERQNATTENAILSDYVYATGQTFYVVGTYDGTTLKIYVDGVLVASAGSGASIPDGDQTQCAIAATNNTGPSWTSFGQGDGVYDEIALYERALSAAEILEHYNVGRGAV